MSRDGIRIDKWLWHARLAKTRSLAGRLCEAGRVELADAAVERPAQLVRIGDRVTISHGGWCRRVEIVGYGIRRGPAVEAQLLYREIEAVRLTAADPDWEPLLGIDDEAE